MTVPAATGRTLFVTLPVADVDRSAAFFARLGFDLDPAFAGDGAACVVVGDHARVMLAEPATFAQVSKLPMGDSRTHALALFSFTVSSREDVDTVAEAALSAGAVEADPLEDLGFMCSRSFFDLDGHGWQVMWLAPVGPVR